VYHLRKDADTKKPYAVCKFFFTVRVILFIIPFCSVDDKSFNSYIDWTTVFDVLPHLDVRPEWVYSDFSSSKAKNFIVNFNGQVRS